MRGTPPQNPPPPTIDVIDSVGRAYQFTWRHRGVIAPLLIIPIFVKLFCAGLYFSSFGESFGFTREAGFHFRGPLLFLPAFFFEGWMLARVARFAMYQEKYLEVPMPSARLASLKAGAVTFLLIQFLLFGLVSLYLMAAPLPTDAKPEALQQTISEASPLWALLALGLTALTFWAFRYLWLYIPIALNVPLRTFLSAVGGMMGSVRLIGLWLISATPLFLAHFVVLSLLAGLFDGIGDGGEALLTYTSLVLRLVTETLSNIVTTLAILMAFKQFLVVSR